MDSVSKHSVGRAVFGSTVRAWRRASGFLRRPDLRATGFLLLGLTLLAARGHAFPADLEPGVRGNTPLSQAADAFEHHTLPKAEFARLVAEYLDHESPLDRIAAMRLIGSQHIDGFDDRLWQLADDPLWPVAYTALWALTNTTPRAEQGRIAEKATAHWATSINILAIRIARARAAADPDSRRVVDS
ncbi:MAG: hypothetical protein HY749_00080 [Gammaproteobacteria bacterium]|nr:hypothetical protein [Gammaproteobacteria bacterium]